MPGSGEAGGRALDGPRLAFEFGSCLTGKPWAHPPLRTLPLSIASLNSFLTLCPSPKGRLHPSMPQEGQEGSINCTGQSEMKPCHPQVTDIPPMGIYSDTWTQSLHPDRLSPSQYMVRSTSPHLTSVFHLSLQDRGVFRANTLFITVGSHPMEKLQSLKQLDLADVHAILLLTVRAVLCLWRQLSTQKVCKVTKQEFAK